MKLLHHHLLPLVLLLILQLICKSTAQQAYVNNKQLDCNNNYTVTDGYICNGVSKSCLSYLTFRTTPTYNSAVTVAFLLNADTSEIARINKISDVNPVPDDTLLIVPVNCSCFSPTPSKSYYQHNTSYVLKTLGETYFSIANNTYASLTTCQAMIFQNPNNFRNLTVGMKFTVPLRCACPTKNQTDAGVKYLLSYPVLQGDSASAIGEMFGVDGDDVVKANELSPEANIFYFTQLLVPLKSEPKKIETAVPPPPPPPPVAPSPPNGNGSSSNKTGLYIGIGIGSGVLVILVAVLFFLLRRRRNTHRQFVPPTPPPKKLPQSVNYSAFPSETSNSWSISSEGVRYAIGSLTLYKFEDLEKATGSFSESNRIRGSVYRASFNGDNAAVKVMRGDVSDEINILKQINHSNIIRLSGFCVHKGNTYLVYEFAENGSISDYLHGKPNSKSLSTLTWKQRVQIAYDVADALNYLHNYTNPPYIHKNLTSSNVLLDINCRAKLSNFGLARTFGEDEGLHLTKHVVGTFGYMPPEYLENGLITPKLDVYAFGVVVLELISGRKAAAGKETAEGELLADGVRRVLGGDNVREKLREFVDGSLGNEYPFDLAYSLAEIAKKCVAYEINDRPSVAEVLMDLSKVLSSSMDWDSSLEIDYSRSLERGR